MQIVRALAAALAASGVLAPAASAGTTDVQAQGNPFAMNLAYYPEAVTAAVGDTVRWTNTDILVPHTVTERHGLWDLAGGYGRTPFNPPGFGPGTSVRRVFEAGTEAYYCRVHGYQNQHGIVAVPVALALTQRRVRVRGSRKRRTIQYVRATWAIEPPASGQGFDVEIQRNDGAWRAARAATIETYALIRAGRHGTVTHVRARLRSAANAAVATGWSPDAQITAP